MELLFISFSFLDLLKLLCIYLVAMSYTCISVFHNLLLEVVEILSTVSWNLDHYKSLDMVKRCWKKEKKTLEDQLLEKVKRN